MNFESDHKHPARFSDFQKCNYARCPNGGGRGKEGLIPCIQCFGAVMYCDEECMALDRVEHSLACRAELTRQDIIREDTGKPLLKRRLDQRNMNREMNGGPALMAKILSDLSAEEKATCIVLVPLMYDDHVVLNKSSPVKLLKKTDVAHAVKHSNALRQVYAWYLQHQRDRRGEQFVYVCIYTPDMALAEMIALPDVKAGDSAGSDKLEHTYGQCKCFTHRGSKKDE